VSGLEELKVPIVHETLALGDFAFVARNNATCEYIILDTIVERKTDSDLIASIPDGRYREQKHRLRNCGMQNVIYLLEGPGEGVAVTNFGEDKYFAAVSQSVFSDDFFVKRCLSMQDTMQFLSDMYHCVCGRFQSGLSIFRSAGSFEETLERFRRQQEICDNLCLPLDLFGRLNSKGANLSFFDVYVQQLMSVHGVSAEKALTIAERFDCYDRLMEYLGTPSTGQSMSIKGLDKLACYFW
jgi:crossover junction endonuclease MUS81